MDRKSVEKLERQLEDAMAEVIKKMSRKKLPHLPDRHTLHMMAKAATAVYEAVAANSRLGEGESMAYSKSLVERIRHAISRQRGVLEKKMFGGVCFLLNGNLLVGVWKDSLIARVGKDTYEAALQEEYVKEFDVTGRPMRGWVMVEPDGIDSEFQLTHWIDQAIAVVRTLPAK
jgi:TfoX/Sxy family transcriptional regulator of competence genes